MYLVPRTVLEQTSLKSEIPRLLEKQKRNFALYKKIESDFSALRKSPAWIKSEQKIKDEEKMFDDLFTALKMRAPFYIQTEEIGNVFRVCLDPSIGDRRQKSEVNILKPEWDSLPEDIRTRVPASLINIKEDQVIITIPEVKWSIRALKASVCPNEQLCRHKGKCSGNLSNMDKQLEQQGHFKMFFHLDDGIGCPEDYHSNNEYGITDMVWGSYSLNKSVRLGEYLPLHLFSNYKIEKPPVAPKEDNGNKFKTLPDCICLPSLSEDSDKFIEFKQIIKLAKGMTEEEADKPSDVMATYFEWQHADLIDSLSTSVDINQFLKTANHINKKVHLDYNMVYGTMIKIMGLKLVCPCCDA
jgi:hypothetical protein